MHFIFIYPFFLLLSLYYQPFLQIQLYQNLLQFTLTLIFLRLHNNKKLLLLIKIIILVLQSLIMSQQNKPIIKNTSYNLPDSNQQNQIQNNNSETFGPIHSGSQSSFLLSNNKYSFKPAFGSTSSKQPKQFKGTKLSDIIAYSRINYYKNQKYLDRYEQVNHKSAPFLSQSIRFSSNKINNPGPASYILPELIKGQNELKKEKTGMYSPFKKWQNKSQQVILHKLESLKQRDKGLIYCQEQWKNDIKSPKQIQQRIKRKKQQIKQRTNKLRQLMSKPQIKKLKSELSKNECFKHKDRKKQEKQNVGELNQKHGMCKQGKKMDFKTLTSSYLPKSQFKFQKQEFRSGSKLKNFKDTHNNHPIFIAKNENLFSSYINSNDAPGPGYYEKKTKRTHRKESYIIKKIFS